MSTTDRNQLAEKMNLGSKHLKFWWRNRRQRDKKTIEPKEKRNVSYRSTSAAPSPTPSYLSSSCSDQWQPPYIHSTNQPTDAELQNVEMLQYPDNFRSMPYQSAPVQYVPQSDHFPHFESAWFPMNGQMVPYLYASTPSNGMEMMWNARNRNMLENSQPPSPCYYEVNTATMNGHFTHTSDSSTQFTQFNQQIKVEPIDEANVDCSKSDGLNSSWQQSKTEFLQYFPFDQ